MSLSNSRIVAAALAVLNVLLALPLCLYAAATPFTRLGYDDFCSAIIARAYGIPGAVSWWYSNLNGRFAAFLINSTTTLVGPALQALYVTALLIVWWAALYFLFRKLIGQRPYSGQQAGILTSLLILATLTAEPSIAATLYWHTGTSIYLMSLVAFTGYLALLAQQRFRRTGWVLFLCALLCFAVAGGSDTGGLSAILFFVTALAFTFLRPDAYQHLRPRLFAGLFGVVVAMALVLAAPGNAIRVALSPPPSLAYTLQVIVSSPGAPALVAFHFVPLNTLMMFVVPFLAGYFAPVAGSFGLKRRARIAVLAMFAAFAVLMAASFGPVAYFLTAGLNEHAWIAPLCLFMLLLMGCSFALGISFKPRRAILQTPLIVQGVVIVLVAVFALNSTAYALDTLAHQRAYAAAWDARDADIRARIAQGQGTPFTGAFTNPYDLRIKVDPNAMALPIDSLRRVSAFKWEANDDPNTLANRCIARYYGLSAVVGVP